MNYYHYASASIEKLVMATVPNLVPNFDKAGVPRLVYFTDSLYTSKLAAETALLIGSKHPGGPRSSPEFRFELDVTLCGYTKHGIVIGGTAVEYTTPDRPLVTSSTRLGP